MIIIKGRKPEVLAALYNASKLGILQFRPEPITVGDARIYLQAQTYFDYLNGRVMKVDFSGDVLDTRLYDRDNGSGAAIAAVASL